MARKFSLESLLTLTDKWTKPLADAGRKYSGFAKGLQTKFNGINRSVESFNKKIRNNRAAQGGFIAAGAGLAVVTKQYLEFDDALVSAGAKFKDMNLATDEGQKVLERLRQKAREAGAATQFSAVEAAKGLEFLAMAGFTSVQAMDSLGTMIDLATASNTEFSRAADISSDLLGAFNLASQDSAIQLKNLIRLNDVLAKTSASANVNLEDMFETMKVAGPIASGLNIPLEEIAAITGVLGNAGLKGSVGGTALKNMLLSLSAPTAEAERALKKLRVETKDLNGNLKMPTQLLKEMKEGLDRIPGTANKAAILNDIFGKIPIASMTKLVSSLDEIGSMRELLDNAGGSAEQMATLMRESLGNQLKIVGSAATELGFKFLSAFDEDGRGGLKSLAKAISEFDVKPIIISVKILFSIIAFGYKILKPFLPLIISVVAALQAYEFIIKGLALAQKAWIVITKIWLVTTKAVTIAQWAFNVAMSANPIGLTIIAVAGLIAVLTVLAMKWDSISAWLDQVTEKLNKFGVVGKMISFILRLSFKPLELLIRGIRGLGSAFDYIKGKLGLGGKTTISQTTNTNQTTVPSQPIRPSARGMTTNNTTVNRSEVGINVNAPKGTTVKQRGNPAPGTTLNLGVQ